MKNSILPVFTLCIAAGLLSACTGLKVHSWSDPAYAQRPMGKTLVVGVGSEDTARRSYEDILANALDAAGVQTVKSYSLLPQSDILSEAEVQKAVKSTDAKSVIVTWVASVKDKKEYVQPIYHGGYYGHYEFSYRHMHTSEYSYSYAESNIEIALYDVASEKLVWSGKTSVTDDTSDKKNMQALSASIIKDLKKLGMISAPVEN